MEILKSHADNNLKLLKGLYPKNSNIENKEVLILDGKYIFL